MPEAATLPEGSTVEPRARLETLPRRQRITGEQAAARSKLVRRLRIVLPALAIVLLAGFFLNTRTATVDEAFLEDFTDLNAKSTASRAGKPTFEGVDNKGQPYEITADEAMQAPDGQEIFDLVKPRAVSQGISKDTVVYANHGTFRADVNRLDLNDDVTLEHKIGKASYVLKTPSATVAIRDETVQSTAGVEGVSTAGTLKADRMRAFNAEGRVVFEGNVSMRIYPKEARALRDGDEDKDEDEENNGEPQ
jgi:lipopolysaccharide export system protein LptC